jgi:hypothetical protein
MANSAKTSQAGDAQVCPVADDQGAAGAESTDGTRTGSNGGSPHAPASEPPKVVSMRPAWGVYESLPPGPSMPALFQMLGYWYRREAFLARCRSHYGNRFTLRIRVPPMPFVVLSDPDDIKQMCLAPPDVLYAGDGSAQLEKYFGPTGLAFMEEDEHLSRRRLISQITHGDGAQRMSELIAKVVEREVASWPTGEVTPMYPRVHRLAVKLMREVSFGPEHDPRLDELLDVHIDMLQLGNSFMSLVPTHTLPPRALRMIKAIRPLGFARFFERRAHADRLIREVVEDRRRDGGGGDGLVSLLLSAKHEDGSPLSWVELRDEVVTTLVAGAESSAATISFAMERLAHEPRIRERLVAEVDAGEGDAYLTATVQEILRVKPVVPMIPRLVMKPVEIGGIHYPPGVRLWGNAYLVHTNPDVYPDPYTFRPERFLEKPPGTYTWIPFGGGRRRCLGQVIAERELKCVLREVLLRYEWQLEREELEPRRSRGAAIVPKNGLRMTLTERSREPALAAG